MDKPFLDKLRKIDPYVPGEQPKTADIIKLNANENPYPPAPGVTEVLRTFDAAKLAIYPDANAKALKTAIAERFDLQPSQVFLGNGSDDVLALAFQSFFCSDKPILYPDITYSFYPVWCDLFRIPYENMPLDEDFCVNVRDYDKPNGGIVLPNPNAPTGRGVTLEFLEDLLQHNQDCVVIIDEAYVDFGAQSAVLLLDADECGNAAHDQQDDECKQQSRHDAGHIDPDIHHRRGAVGAVQLDGLIHQRRCHAAQQRPAHVAHKMLCVHADAEHQQKALQRKLRKVRELTDQMLRQWAEMHLGQRTVDQLHDGLAACGRLGTVFQ